MLVEWTVGMIVLALSLTALIGLALRASDPPHDEPDRPAVAVTHDGLTERAGEVSELVEPTDR